MIQTAYPSKRLGFERGMVRHSRVRGSIPKDLAGYWGPPRHRMSDVWHDSSIHRNHGTLTLMTPETDREIGPNGWQLDFDGTNDYVDAGTRRSLEFTTAFTLVVRCRHDDAYVLGRVRGLVNKFLVAGANRSYSFFIFHTAGLRRLYALVSETGAVSTVCDSAFDVDTEWHTLAYSFDRGTWTFYVDGVAVRTGAAGYAAVYNAATIPFTFGQDYVNREWLGPIEYVAAFNQALSPRRLLQMHDRGSDPLGLAIPRPVTVRRLALMLEALPVALDLSKDYKSFDNKISITLNGAVVLSVVILEKKRTEGAPSEGAYLHRNCELQLPTVPVQAPSVGDIAVAEGVTYNVLSVREPFAGDFWGLDCREIAITTDADLKDTVTLYPAVRTILPGGGTKTKHTVASGTFQNVAAKIQPLPSRIEDRAGKRDFVEEYEVLVAMDIGNDLKAGDVLKDGDGKQYKIVSWRNRQRIDKLSSIMCEIPPGV